MKLIFYLILTIVLFGALCTSSRILFLLPIASQSHVNVFQPLMRALGQKGHEIITLSPFESTNMPETVTQIQITKPKDLSFIVQDPFKTRSQSFLTNLLNTSAWDPMNQPCQVALTNPLLHQLLIDSQSKPFDLIIVDIMWNFCMLGVIPILKAPAIFVTTLAAPPSISNVVGNRLPSSFVPSLFLGYSDRMSFAERLINTITDSLVSRIWQSMATCGEAQYKKFLPNGKNLPGSEEIQKNVSLILSNSHFTLTYPRPLLPDVIEVGGMHTRPAKPLPKDLDDFFNGSRENGFIFFSLGSIAKAREMPEETRQVFVNVFGRLKQRVIWKWDGEDMPDRPKNVKLMKWLPQQDILGHPKIKLFMTHGGLLSTQESVYHGVPVLGLPLFADQDLNIKMAEKRGYAKFVEIVNLQEDILSSTISELLNNPSYSQNVKQLSKLVRDLPMSPIDTAVYWTEYVLRHKGAVHLKSAARDLNFAQYYALDVALIIVITLIILIAIILQCCKCCCKRICRMGEKKTKQE